MIVKARRAIADLLNETRVHNMIMQNLLIEISMLKSSSAGAF